MNKCLRVTCSAQPMKGVLRAFIQKHARQFNLEGTAQVVDELIRIMICGKKEDIDTFIDVLHSGSPKFQLHDIEIEPFFKEKDYRSVFRVIE